jgi:hypothetical protein
MGKFLMARFAGTAVSLDATETVPLIDNAAADSVLLDRGATILLNTVLWGTARLVCRTAKSMTTKASGRAMAYFNPSGKIYNRYRGRKTDEKSV